MSHCPADDASGPHIQHDGEIQETRPGRHIGDVGDPESIRTLGAEAPVDLVQRAIRLGVCDGRGDELRRRQALQPGRSHEPRHALAPDADPVIVSEFGMNAGRTVRFARTAMDRADPRRQCNILEGIVRENRVELERNLS